jgi:tRNA G18 (ribose-2'-O)-methylase SpoU
MTLIRIDSLDDPRVAIYRDLRARVTQRDPVRFVVESVPVVHRLLASRLRVDSVLTEDRFVETLRLRLPDGVPLYVLERNLVHELAGYRLHRGVLACGYRPATPDLAEWLDSRTPGTWTVCVGVQDQENLGSILRTSAAFGVRGVLLGQGCPDPFARRVARTSMGANFQLAIRETTNLQADLTRLRDQGGIRLIATTLEPAARRLSEVRGFARQAVLLGGEGYGLDQRWTDLCELQVTIPIASDVDSLNVGVAAGIALHHLAIRDRRNFAAG